MAKHGFKVIDTELHLEEPLDLFDTRLEEPFRSLTRIAGPPEGRNKDGGKRFSLGGNVGDNSANESAQLVQKQSARRLREEPLLLKARTACTPQTYLEALDIEGIDVAILMPTLMLGLSAMDDVDPAHIAALCRVYNNWTYEFTRADPDRFRFWAWVPRQDPRLAAAEARRCVEDLGAVGAAMPSPAVNGNLLSDDFFYPLWAELQRLNVPIGFHPGGGRLRDDVRSRYRGHRRTGVIQRTMARQYYAGTAVAELILGGALEDFPDLQVVVMEAGVSWLPWLLWWMDEQYEMFEPDLDYQLKLKPSEYFARQCYAVVDCSEDIARYTIDFGLADRLLLSTDYPHHDSPFPNGVEMFLAHAGISDEHKRKVLWDNGARVFGLDRSPQSATLEAAGVATT
jgi:predicted TIM-barrel fold metal-dependent hydrolase